MDTITFKNPTPHTVKLAALGLPDVPPGGTVDVPIAYAAPGRSAANQRTKSPLETVAPQLEPVAEGDKEVIAAVPPPVPPISRPVTVATREAPESPGVRALKAARAAAAKE